MGSIGDRTLHEPEILDEGAILCPFAFVIAGSANPVVATVQGACVLGRAVTRVSAGLYTFVMSAKPYAVIGGGANISGTSTEDITVQVDATAAPTTGVVTIRFKTGGTATDPADTNVCLGHLIVTKTDRRVLT